MSANHRILGLDIGSKTIGVAVSDGLGWTARPVCTIRRASWESDLSQLRQLQREYGAELLVVGLPLGHEGEMTSQAEFNQRAAERIQTELNLPVEYVDESLSSQEAEDIMREMGLGRKKRRQKQKQNLDELAAARILQGYLDENNRLQPKPTNRPN